MRFRVEGTRKRGGSVGQWALDAASAEAAWLQAEELGIIVTKVIASGESNGQRVALLDRRPASLPPQTFAPSLAGVVWTVLLALVALFVCFMMVSTGLVAGAAALLVFLVALAVVELVRYLQCYVDYKISQYNARSRLAEQGAAAGQPRDQGPTDVTAHPA